MSPACKKLEPPRCDKHHVRERLWEHQPWRGREGFLEEVMAKKVLKDEKELPRDRGLHARYRGLILRHWCTS